MINKLFSRLWRIVVPLPKASGTSRRSDHLPHLNQSIHLGPSGIWSRLLIYALSSGSIAIFVWASFTKVDETIVLSGILGSEQGSLSIRSPSDGFIANCFVKRHQRVESGGLICTLVNEDILSQEASESARIILLEDQVRSIDATLALRQAQLTDRIKLDTELLRRLEQLLESGAVQEVQVLEKQTSLAELISQEQALDEESRRNKINISLQLTEAKASLVRLSVNRRRFFVKAPLAGYIQSLPTKSEGERIQAGEVLAELIPIDSLVADVSSPSRLNSKLAVGDQAAISVDAFPSQDYGTLSASILSISPTANLERTERPSGPVFNVRLTLIPEAGNNSFPSARLQSGMGVTARFSTRSRPMITYVFDFLDKFISPLGESR